MCLMAAKLHIAAYLVSFAELEVQGAVLCSTAQVVDKSLCMFHLLQPGA